MAQTFLEGSRFLMSSRLRRIVQTLQTKLDLEAPLIWLRRVPVVQAFDDELFGRFSGQVFAADVIADDQKAVVYESGQVKIYTNQVPNLKLGRKLSQGILNRLQRMKYGALLPGEDNALQDWENQTAEHLVQGVRIRMQTLALAMITDGASMPAYNRWGLNLGSGTPGSLVGAWGSPTNLRVTIATPWTTDGVTPNASALPITDIQTIANETAPDLYGIRYDRATMSSAAFRFMVGSNEFRDKAQLVLGFQVLSTGQGNPLTTHDQATMLTVAGRLLNMEIELYDSAYPVQGPDGTAARVKYLPQNLVVLTQTANDGDGNIWDMANCPVTESMVADLVGEAPQGLGGNQYGPVGYYTASEHDMNPPGVIAWGTARAFPRRYVPEAAATLVAFSAANSPYRSGQNDPQIT